MHDVFPFDELLPERWPAPSAPGAELVEFTDEKDRLLLVAPLAEAARLGLCHKVVGVALSGPDGRLRLRRRSGREPLPSCLDLSGVAHVRPGESRQDAALRALGRPLAGEGPILARKADFVLASAGGRQQVTLFLAGPDRMGLLPPLPEAGKAGELCVDRDELEGLALSAPELLTPALLWSARSGLLWPV